MRSRGDLFIVIVLLVVFPLSLPLAWWPLILYLLTMQFPGYRRALRYATATEQCLVSNCLIVTCVQDIAPTVDTCLSSLSLASNSFEEYIEPHTHEVEGGVVGWLMMVTMVLRWGMQRKLVR